MALVRALPAFRGDALLKTYVMRVAHNVCLREVMRHREWNVEQVAELADQTASPERNMQRLEDGDRLMTAIRELPVGYRQVLTLALEDLSPRDIAEALGITENAVAIRMHRARRMLKGRLEER